MWSAREPLLVPFVAFAGGIALAQILSLSTLELAWTTSAIASLCCVAALWARRVLWLPVCIGVLLLGILTAQARRPALPPQLTEEDDQEMIVPGCVVEPPTLRSAAMRFVVEIEPGARMRALVTPRPGESLPEVHYGQSIEVQARVRAPSSFGNPGSFDYPAYLGRQQIYWTASARGAEKLRVVAGECGSAWARFWHEARITGLRRLEQLFGEQTPTTALLAGMLLGDGSGLQRSWTDDYRKTGTFHALVISGLHISLIAGGVLALLHFVPLPMWSRSLLAGAVAWGYVCLTGLQPPAIRAAGGFTLFLIAKFFYRRGELLNLMAAVAFVWLALNPVALFDASFQLSFLAVVGIGAFGTPLLRITSNVWRFASMELSQRRRDPWFPAYAASVRVELQLLSETIQLCLGLSKTWSDRAVVWTTRGFTFFFDLVAISAVVQLALLLPMVAYFHRISLTNLSANVAIVPALSAATPIGLLAILTKSSIAGAITGWLVRLSSDLASWHAHWEASWRIPELPLWLQVAFTLSLVMLAVAFRRERWRRAAAIVSLTLALVIYIHPFSALNTPGELEVSVIDVGQGDSILIKFPDGRTMLMDAGGIPVFDPRFKPRLDIGEDVVSSYLWKRGIKHIDIVAMSHAHDDHAQGLQAVIANFHPKELWTGAQPRSGTWVSILNEARVNGVTVRRMDRGSHNEIAGVKIDSLAPFAEMPGGNIARNNDSLVLRLQYGRHRFLLTGDVERQVEQTMLDDAADSPIDVLKVAHHGSKTSSAQEFLERIRPAFAIISAGRYNSYHHPHPDVLDRLAALNTQVLRTDQDGLITVYSNGKHLRLSTFRESKETALWASPVDSSY